MIKVYVGISGSGKTTLCKKEISKNKNAVRINRDDLRTAVFGLDYNSYFDYFKRDDLYQCEQFITDLEDRIISRAISKGKDIYADNTHLKQRYIKKYYKYGVDVEIVWCDVDIQVAEDRNENRTDHSVGFDVLMEQYHKYKELKKNWVSPEIEKSPSIFNDPSKKKCYIFDIDGTLAQKGDRSPYDYSRVSEDTRRDAVACAYSSHYNDNYEIIICSGRDSSCREETERWLIDNYIFYSDLYMRAEGDPRPDWMVKEEMWREICKDYYIVAMYDDRNQVVDHARSLGFDVFQVAEGDF